MHKMLVAKLLDIVHRSRRLARFAVHMYVARLRF